MVAAGAAGGRPRPAGAQGRTARPRPHFGELRAPAAPAAPSLPRALRLPPCRRGQPRTGEPRAGAPGGAAGAPHPSRPARGGCGAGLALPIRPPLAAGRAGGLGLACGCSAGLGVSHPAFGAASRARRHTGEAAGAGGERRGRQHRLPARPLAHAAEPQSAGAPLPPQPPPMTSSPVRSR